jgi:hypothetical protein
MLGSSSKNPKHLDMEKKKQEISWKPNLENTIHVVYKGNRQKKKKQIQMFFTRLSAQADFEGFKRGFSWD